MPPTAWSRHRQDQFLTALTCLWLGQLEEDTVFGLLASRAVDSDDLDDLVEQSWALAAPGAADPGLNMRTGSRGGM